jgi:hypothetical protein
MSLCWDEARRRFLLNMRKLLTNRPERRLDASVRTTAPSQRGNGKQKGTGNKESIVLRDRSANGIGMSGLSGREGMA